MNIAHRTATAAPTAPKRWRWYHGLLFFGAVQGSIYGFRKGVQQGAGRGTLKAGESIWGNPADDAYYNSLMQPRFAPPDWLFGPVWTINNALCIWGLLRVLNLPKETPGRTTFLMLQGTVWVSFSAFNGLYFGMRSPINGAVDTNIGFVATIMSMYVALFRLKDGRTALSQSTILPWLLLASATATSVAAWNADEFYGTGPWTEASPTWVKTPR